MQATVFIKHGFYRAQELRNRTFTMIKPVEEMKKGLYVTVDGTGHSDLPAKRIRIKVKSVDSVKMAAEASVDTLAPPVAEKTDEEIIDEMREKFSILDDMGGAAITGVVRGMIVSGPPGIGKSYGLEQLIDEATSLNKLSDKDAVYGMEKGYSTPVHLYCTLYDYRHVGSVLVLDDMDSVLFDEQTLNLLKAALDSGKRRYLSWKSESSALRRRGEDGKDKEQIPNTFEFKGAVVFITNLNFDQSAARNTKIAKHLDALISRCHYLDMGISGQREKLLRCQQIVQDGMLRDYGFQYGEEQEVLDYMKKNKDNLRELSLRMVAKIADLRKMSKNRWENYANNTCLKSYW